MNLNLILTTLCNASCDYCFHGDGYLGKQDNNNKHMTPDDVGRLMDWYQADGMHIPYVYFLGGEPTMNPHFEEIMGLIEERLGKKRFFLMTNMLWDLDYAKSMAERTEYPLVNIKTFSDIQTAKRNDALAYFRDNTSGWNATLTITDPDEDLSDFYEVIREYKPRVVRPAISTPGRGYSNNFPEYGSEKYGSKLVEVVEKVHSINPKIQFQAECAVSGCFMSSEDYTRLQPVFAEGLGLRTTSCNGNFDIYPDMHTSWCPALEDMDELYVDNVLDHQGPLEMMSFLQNQYMKKDDEVGVQCYAKDGDCKKVHCGGPCLAYNNLYMKNRSGTSQVVDFSAKM